MKKVNIDEVKIVNATSPSKRRHRNSKAIGIVKNNSRVSLNKQLIEQLGSPKSVQIGTVTDEDGKHLVVAESLKDGSSFKLKGDGNLIYNTELVKKSLPKNRPNSLH
jgi:hypothetical protein